MTQDEIIDMAREADCSHVDLNGDKAKAIERLEAFAKLVAAKEREACMNVLRGLNYAQSSKYDCMDAIRARGGQA